MPKNQVTNLLQNLEASAVFQKIYGHNPAVMSEQIKRYANLTDQHNELFGVPPTLFFSAPGRTEISGNHTDHNHGKVLAASVDLDSIAAVNANNGDQITIFSEGYPQPFIIDTNHCSPVEAERGTTTALVRGIVARFKELGFRVGSFNATLTSNVLVGSGLSSSASIEVLLGTIMNHLFNGAKIAAEEIALIGQFAENHYFGKPCGLMDQLAIAVGGVVAIDFKNPSRPIIQKVNYDPEQQNYSWLIVNTGTSHVNLTEEYAAIPREMRAVAKALGGQVCRDLTMENLIDGIPDLRPEVGDRAILRAFHFLTENERVQQQIFALERGDFAAFLELVNESGASSSQWLQNCYPTSNPAEQGIPLALALTQYFLKTVGKKGACRIQGGGFAGTILAFMPNEILSDYLRLITKVFGKDSVSQLNIRPIGAVCLNKI
ncbi:MAG TPA: galactokinase family protein [Candidatus Marinimicrobia bacterium]|nr:galactokinase family protein [Candidatus Neomarinimicrobiota bacterium]HRS51120.1 galactokinase family protein [Candidatus Neomarinimicrobiota bacterium]HRU92801.1 galactokinase family protein [Candidatus Neomarinimicrobiota bacterium]